MNKQIFNEYIRLGLVQRAFQFAFEKHKNQIDDDGLPYVCHCSMVYNTLRTITDDQEILAAAYLHDTLEDTDTTYDELKDQFGERVANLVLEVTHEGKKDSYGYYFPRLLSRDAVLIKFADRLNNLSRMDSWDDERKAQYLRKSKFWKDGSDK